MKIIEKGKKYKIYSKDPTNSVCNGCTLNTGHCS